MKTQKPHSAEYFVEERNHWWNQDHLELIANHLNLNSYKKVLDLGCGLGHWNACLRPHLREDVQITGLDQEVQWVRQAHQQNPDHHYIQGDVTDLPFEDESFDMITCQTLLIHLKHPKKCLKEALRVLNQAVCF